MTTHYIDIILRPDPEFSGNHLLGALMTKLHRALVQRRSSDIGVSFPQHVSKPVAQRTLGQTLRLHGSQPALTQLMEEAWLQGMRDHARLTSVMGAPEDAQHRMVFRRQFKTSAERLRRRRMQRKGESIEQATAAIPDSVERRPNLPFVQLRSSSSGERFCLFVEHGALQPRATPGIFNTYGLSQGASVPWF